MFEGSELVFGLVAPVGTNFDLVLNPLRKLLKQFEYTVNVVRLSDLFGNFYIREPLEVEGSDEFQRLMKGMHCGNALRMESRRGEFMALGAAKSINDRRRELPEGEVVLGRQVHVVRSLKHPDEVRALRRIYGQGFYLFGIVTSEEQRRRYLGDEMGCDQQDEVTRLLARDEHEEDENFYADGVNYGQRTRDTFHLADVFVPLEDKEKLERFVHLVFGAPHVTPTQDEHAMFMAFTSALRSGDLSRQVGAVITSAQGDLIAVGANDVPKAGGGLYWPVPGEDRDHVRGFDSNAQLRDEIVDDLLRRLAPEGVDEDQWRLVGHTKLKGSGVMDLTEYGRAVHAEMEALLSCARSGVSPRGGTLYSTTFPCHNCAKHIVVAGVERVVYVEPYPKSQATKLFKDSIRLHDQEPTEATDKRVLFEPFNGVGPKRFYDLFSMTLSWGTRSKRKDGNTKLHWSPEMSNARVPLLPNSYVDRERLAIAELIELTPEEVDDDVEDIP